MRRTEKLVIPGTRSEKLGERDNGKTFILTEMDAYSGQDWALRMILALARGGAPLPAGAFNSGWAGLASFAFEAMMGASYGDLKPLLDEMLGQAKYLHDPKHPPQPIIAGQNCQVEEIATFLELHKALFKLHSGFTEAASIPTTG